MVIIQQEKKYQELRLALESDLESDVINNSKIFFGKDTIYIDAKRKIDTKSLGGSIPDGFLFDFSDKEDPQFYLIEVELSTHDFYKHIFPQITKFFAFFRNPKSMNELVEKLFSLINNDDTLKKELKKYLVEKEIYKFIKDIIENSQNILLLIDGEKEELPEIFETYTDTWGKLVKLIILKKYKNGNDIVFSMNPEFENLEYMYISNQNIDSTILENSIIDENYHISSINENIKEIYFELKSKLLEFRQDILFNPQKYYISIKIKRNISFLTFSKKKISLVVLLQEEKVKELITKYKIKHLSDSVQKFWNGPSCEVIIDNKDGLNEIIDLLKILIETNSSANSD